MLQVLKELIDHFLPPLDEGGAAPDPVQLASAVLLVEVMRADSVCTPQERAAALGALREQFALSAPAAADLVAHAEEVARRASDTFAFTSRINSTLDMAHKIALVESLWRVAYANGGLGPDENHLLGKVADLLYVPQGAYINAKLRARDAVAARGRVDPPPGDGA